MDQFNEAARINSQGVHALLNGNEDKAVASFAACIKIMKSMIVLTNAIQVEPQPSSTSIRPSKDIGESSQMVQLPNVNGEYGKQLQDSSSTLFQQAVAFPERMSSSSPQSPPPSLMTEQDIQWCTAVVVFNLAMAHHRKGKKMGLSGCIIKAKQLYSMVLKLAIHEYKDNDDDSSSHSAVIGVLVTLACLNNLLEIRMESGQHLDLGQNDDTPFVLSQVSHILSSSQHAASVQEAEDMEHLFMNILRLHQPPQVAPAA